MTAGEHLNCSIKVISVLPSSAARPSKTAHLKSGPAQTDRQTDSPCCRVRDWQPSASLPLTSAAARVTLVPGRADPPRAVLCTLPSEPVRLGWSLGISLLLTCLFRDALAGAGVKGAELQGAPSLPRGAGSDGLSPGLLCLRVRPGTPPSSELQNLHHDCVLFVPCRQGAPAPAAHGTDGNGRNWTDRASTRATAAAARKRDCKNLLLLNARHRLPA